MYHVVASGSKPDAARPDATRIKLLHDIKDPAGPRPPRVWILASRHSGDNTQLNAIADALGWPCEVKRLFYRTHEVLVRLAGLASLSAVDRHRSSPIAPPWPDVILAAGRSTEAVARWIKRHGNPEVRTVFVGTPWADPAHFDLVITTPQYRLPEAPNILHLSFAAHSVTPERLAAERAVWAPRLGHLPEPRIAVLVGGPSGPYTFGTEAAKRLGRAASHRAARRGGSLLVTTSARTPPAAAEALADAISVPARMFRHGDEGGNPFFGFLALAEEVIVTADSVSMISEACAAGRPVWLFDIEDGPQAMRAEEGEEPLPPIHWRGKTLETTAFRLLINHAPPRWSRDLRILHRRAVQQGFVRWLEEAAEAPPPPVLLADSVAMAAARIRALFGL